MAVRRSYATQHPAPVETEGMDPEMQKTLGVDNPHATPEGRKRAKQQPGESNAAYLRRQRARVNEWRRHQGLAPLED